MLELRHKTTEHMSRALEIGFNFNAQNNSWVYKLPIKRTQIFEKMIRIFKVWEVDWEFTAKAIEASLVKCTPSKWTFFLSTSCYANRILDHKIWEIEYKCIFNSKYEQKILGCIGEKFDSL